MPCRRSSARRRGGSCRCCLIAESGAGRKALALGAVAVLLGRLNLYGLAVAGEQGVRDVLQNFLADFDITLGSSGRASVKELDRSMLQRAQV